MGCQNCPDYIKAAVSQPVDVALAQVLSVKKLVTSFNNFIRNFPQDALDAILSELSQITIPAAPVIDPGEILNILTCPITPIAIGLDPSILAAMDPTRVLVMIQQVMGRYLNELVRTYDQALRALEAWKTVKVLQQFFTDLKRVNLNALVIAEATALCAAVKALCLDFYTEGPFQQFDQEISTFSVTGFLPSGIDSKATSVMAKLQENELKIQAWRALAVA